MTRHLSSGSLVDRQDIIGFRSSSAKSCSGDYNQIQVPKIRANVYALEFSRRFDKR